MRRSLSVKFATIVLVAAMAMPAMAAPRDDSPIGRFDRAFERIVKIVKHLLPLDLANFEPPKP